MLWGDDDAAGDTPPGVAGRVGLHVVGLLVDHDGGAPVGEDGVGGGGVKGHVLVHQGYGDLAVGLHGQVLGHVAVVVAVGILVPVLLACGVEVSTGGLEVGRIALGVLVDVDGVLAGRQVLQVDLYLDSGFGLLEDDF